MNSTQGLSFGKALCAVMSAARRDAGLAMGDVIRQSPKLAVWMTGLESGMTPVHMPELTVYARVIGTSDAELLRRAWALEDSIDTVRALSARGVA